MYFPDRRADLKPAPWWPLRRKKLFIKILLLRFLISFVSKRGAYSPICPNLLVIKPFVESKNPPVNLRRLSNRAVPAVTQERHTMLLNPVLGFTS